MFCHISAVSLDSLRGRGETENKKAQGWGHLASQVLFCCDAGVKMKYGGVP